MNNEIKNCLTVAIEKISKISTTASLDSDVLLLDALNQLPAEKPSYPRSFLRTWPEYQLTKQQLQLFWQHIEKRKTGIPIAYITGKKEFWSMDLQVNEHTLIPRPDTEVLVEQALQLIPKQAQWNILDLGTGSGAIALAIASERKNCQLIASDKSFFAIKIAKENAQRLNIRNCQFICSSWLQAFTQKSFQVIVSNPPYIRENDPHLEQIELQYEPISALKSGHNGLADIEQIIKHTSDKLLPPALLLLEHGFDQANQLKQLLLSNNYKLHSQAKDYNDIVRVTIASL